MKIINSFKSLSKFEWGLWIISMIVITVSFLLGSEFQLLTLVASLIGVTSLIFIAKGNVLGQTLLFIFCILYAIISFGFRYYGEMITYLGMTAPMVVLAIITWIKNPFAEDKQEVEIAKLTKTKIVVMIVLTIIVTTIMYFVLAYFHTANLFLSTISIATSFIGAYLTFCRNSLYALGYAANDLVLVGLWILASLKNTGYIPMVLCFVMFFFNDYYGFYNWNRMKKWQQEAKNRS